MRYSPPCTIRMHSASGSSACTSTAEGVRTPAACTARVEARTVQAAARDDDRSAGARALKSTVARDGPSWDSRIAGSAASCVSATTVDNAPVSAAAAHMSRHEAQRSAGRARPARTWRSQADTPCSAASMTVQAATHVAAANPRSPGAPSGGSAARAASAAAHRHSATGSIRRSRCPDSPSIQRAGRPRRPTWPPPAGRRRAVPATVPSSVIVPAPVIAPSPVRGSSRASWGRCRRC